MDRGEEDFSFGTMYGQTLINLSTTAKIKNRQYFSFRQTVLADPIDYDESLEELVKQTWTIWAVSMLFGFEYKNEVKLKLYAKKLREEVACSLLKEDVSYNAKFTVMEDMGPRPNSTDVPIVKIELIATSGTEVEKCIYKGFLISWRTQCIEPLDGTTVNLPLLLCRGTQGSMRAVHSIMSRMFDCTIVALPISDIDLKWLFPINLCQESGEKQIKNHLALLEYVVPGLPLTDTISIKFRMKDVKELWTTITSENEENVQSIQTEHVEKFYKILYTQMLETANLKLGLCSFHKLSLPSLTISGNRMKVMNLEALNNTLLFLNEKALEVLYTLNVEPMSLNNSSDNS